MNALRLFELRHADLRDHPRLETGGQPLVDVADLARLAVAGQNDLLVLPVQRVEDVEKLLLHVSFLGEAVDIVDEQHIHVAQRRPERRKAALVGQALVRVVRGQQIEIDPVSRANIANHNCCIILFIYASYASMLKATDTFKLFCVPSIGINTFLDL